MAVKNLFSGARFVGQAEGERLTYHVFQTDNGYLVAAPRSAHNYSVSVVPQEAPEVIGRRFKGERVTVKTTPRQDRIAGLIHGKRLLG